jgi:tRNA A37 threonylcarbamoyladenosine modification protein TsaB
MAWLFLDTHENGRVRLTWLKDGKPVKSVEKEGRAAILLPLIAKDMARFKLAGVGVVAGPGSFSAVRTGVLDANLIARLLKVPLLSFKVGEAFDPTRTPVDYVAPIYDAEPNITTPHATRDTLHAS